MSRRNSLLIGTFAALLLIAIGIVIAPSFQNERAEGGAPSAKEEVLASLPAVDTTQKNAETAREVASDGPAAGARNSQGANGRILTLDGGPIPAGTRVVVRLDNPDFMSEMSFGELMRKSFQRGPAGQRELLLQARKNRRESGGFVVSADGKFQCNPPPGVPFYLDIQSDGLTNDSWDKYISTDKAIFVVRARRAVLVTGKVVSPDGSGLGGADVTFVDHRMPGSGGKMHTPLDIRTKARADGSFTLPAVPLGLAGTVVARRTGFAAGSTSVKVTNEAPNVTVTLGPSARVIGKVVNESGEPIAGASIQIFFGDLATYGVEIDRGPQATNEEGFFELKDIPPVPMRVRAEKEKLRPATSPNIEIRPGATCDAGIIILKNGTAIRGKVVKPDGEPAPGANVRLEFSTQMNQMEQGEGGATIFDHSEMVANAEGQFTIEGMGSGPYDLEATFPGFAPARKKRYKSDGSDILILKLRKPGALRALLHWPDGSPAPETGEVTFEVQRPVGPGFNISEIIKTSKYTLVKSEKGSSGEAAVDDVAPGGYNIIIRSRGYARARAMGIEIKSGAPTDVNIEMAPGITVTGRVLDRASKAPLDGARVVVSGNMMDMFRSDLPATVSGEDGKFELFDLDSGPVSISALYADRSRSSVSLGNQAPGANVNNVELLLGLGGGVEGQAFGEDGMPMAGGMATLNAPDRGEFEQSLLDRDGRFGIYRLSPGNYQLSILRGSFISDMGTANPGDILKGMRFTAVDVREGEITKIVIGEERGNYVKVRGKVRSRNQPVAGAIVTAVSQGTGGGSGTPPRFDTTDPQGNFEMQLAAGRVVFTIQRMTGTQSGCEIPVEIPERPSHEVTLNLPLGTIDGIVKGPKNEPLSGQPIMLTIEAGSVGSLIGAFGQATTDEDGRFRFESLAPGTYLISAGGSSAFFDAAAAAYGRVSKRVELKDSEQLHNIDFNIDIAGAIVGTVVSGGQPVPGASIFLQMPDGQAVSRVSDVVTNAGGQFKARGIAGGTYRLMARAKGLASKFIDPVVVEPGRDVPIQIELAPGAPAVARIADGEGKAVSGTTIILTDSSGRKLSGFAGMMEFAQWFADGPPQAGDVRLGNLASGRYRVVISKPEYAPATVDFEISGLDPKTIEVRLQKQ